MRVTVLGCGASLGTPAGGGYWGVCDPAEPRNERTRASILVRTENTNVIVDATHDMRLHLNRMTLQKVDGLLLSHAHSDHVNGLDDLRAVAYRTQKSIPVYADRETLDEIDRRWPYLFEAKHEGIYQPFMEKNEIGRCADFTVGDLPVQSFAQDHTTCISVGYRFGNFAYSPDMADLSAESLDRLRGVEVWLVDAGSYHKETVLTHANLQRVRQWVDILRPKMTYLTILTTHMDYKTLCDELPPHIRPAYDGLEIDMAGNAR
jgi:phosphoribosyl 1,2-cyclic phosphate phosphodiesterase